MSSLLVTLFSNQPKLISLHTVMWFQVLLPNANSFICTFLNNSK